MEDAVRLTFEYRDGQFVSRPPRRVTMVVPQLETEPPSRSAVGRFVELRAANGKTLFATRVSGHELPRVEYPTGDPEQPFGRTAPPPGAIVSVLVAADDRATHAALVEVKSESRGVFEKTRIRRRDLATVSLSDGADE